MELNLVLKYSFQKNKIRNVTFSRLHKLRVTLYSTVIYPIGLIYSRNQLIYSVFSNMVMLCTKRRNILCRFRIKIEVGVRNQYFISYLPFFVRSLGLSLVNLCWAFCFSLVYRSSFVKNINWQKSFFQNINLILPEQKMLGF